MDHACLLSAERITVGYGPRLVVRDVSLCVPHGRIVALVGANGAGKTTLMRALMGLLRTHQGRMAIDGHDLTAQSPATRVRLGMSLSPEGRVLCPELSVVDNVLLGAYAVRLSRHEQRERLEDIISLFAPLQARRHHPAGVLSGGEQQMVAMARALMANPRLLLLDEPTLGLSPAMAEHVFALLETLRSRHVAVLMAEQHAAAALAMADVGYVLAAGSLVHHGPADELAAHPLVRQAFLGGV